MSLCVGLIILNAWYGKFVSDTSQKQEKAKVIDVTVPLQCLVKDSKLILTESSKVRLCDPFDDLEMWMHRFIIVFISLSLTLCLGWTARILRPLCGRRKES